MSKSKEFKNINPILDFDVEGKVEAVFSVFNTVDSDGDVVLPDSIKSGFGDKGVAMVWGHDWKDVIGRGEIVTDNDKAVFKGEFIMDTKEAERYNIVKAMGDLQQWSFGYEVVDSEKGAFQKDGFETQDVRYLKELRVWEVSPVLVGANQETYTLAVKEDQETEKETKDTGKRFTEEVEEALSALVSVTQRAKELTALRLQKEKKLSEQAYKALSSLADEIQDIYNDIDTMLETANPQQNIEEDNEVEVTYIAETIRLLTETVDI